MFDDFSNILMVKALYLNELSWNRLQEVWSAGITTIIGRPLPVLSFALNHYFAGAMEPEWFKWTNVFIHLVNAVLVYCLAESLFSHARHSALQSVRRQSQSNRLPLLIALVWAIHPLHVSTVLYVVQRMTLMSATFSLLSMLVYIRIRTSAKRSFLNTLVRLGCLGFFLVCGLLCKENAALSMFYILLLEVFLFGFLIRAERDRWVLIAVIGLGVAAPTLLATTYLLLNPEWLLTGYTSRDFALTERLLTQLRLFWVYIGWIYSPDISAYGFHHDDIAVSSSLMAPATTLPALMAFTAVVVSVAMFWRRLGLIAFGIWFFIAGHLLESTIIPLEMVFEHRNYLPSLGLIISLASTLAMLYGRLRKQPNIRLVNASVLMVVLMLSYTTYTRADKWGNPLYSAAVDVDNHPDSARSHNSFAAALMNAADAKQNFDLISSHFEQSIRIDQQGGSAHFGLILLGIQAERKVDQAIVDELLSRIAENGPRAGHLVAIDDLLTLCTKVDCEPWFDVENLERMIDAALSNPKVLASHRISYQILKVRYLMSYDQNLDAAAALLQRVVTEQPDNQAANGYLMELYLLGKPVAEKQRLLMDFAESNVGSRHPTLVKRLREALLPEPVAAEPESQQNLNAKEP